MEELQQKLDAETRARQELEEKLGQQMELMTTLVTTFQAAAKGKESQSVYVNHGRKMTVFRDAPASTTETSVQDWCVDVERHLDARGVKGEKAFSFILEHLGGKARQEILGRGLVKNDPDKIFEVLKKTFGEGLTLGQLRTKFFSYKQQPTEDVISCSLKLVEMMTDVVKRDPSAEALKNNVLRERLADAVTDVTIQHELRRLIDEDEKLDFFEARDRVLRWRGEVKTHKKVREAVVQEKVAEADSTILQAIKGLTDQVSKLVEVQRSHPARSSGLDGAGNRVCFACRSKEHMIANCPKKNKDRNTAEKQELNDKAPQL